MPERISFEYAVIRLVPRVEREEFVNVGVVLYCSAQRFLQMRYQLDEQRLSALCSELDIVEIKQYLQAFERICMGDKKNAGPIGKLPIAGRFRWLTATRSTVLQTSKVHPGLCEDAAITLDRIYKEQVL
jgi:hypothetical protein